MISLHALEAAIDQVPQECRASTCPPWRFAVPRISRKPSELTALATNSETLRTSPAQVRFITMPSEIQIRMLAFDAPVPPSLDLGVDLLVEVGHRARAHTRAQSASVMSSTRRTEMPARYISISASLDRASRRR